jgi:hypothetical protein
MRDFHADIAKHVTNLKERVITDAVNQFEKDLRAKMGTVALNLANYYSVERMGGNLVITVRLEGLNAARTV